MKAISVAGASIGLISAEAGIAIGRDSATAQFLTDVTEPDVALRASWQTNLSNDAAEYRFQAGGIWDLAQTEAGYRFRFFASNRGTSPYKEVALDRAFSKGVITLHREYFPPDALVDPLDFPFDELLLIHHLASRGGILVHACGLIADGVTGCLFVGHSGAGKTTTASLWQGRAEHQILSDDRIALRSTRDGIMMYGTPWHGTGRMASPASAPLGAVFLLERGDESRLEPMVGAEAIAALLARCFIPYHDVDAAMSAIALLEQVAASVPTFRFPFRPDRTAVQAVEDWIAHNNGRG